MFKKALQRVFSIPNPDIERGEWIVMQLSKINKGSSLLDAGCGNQPYRHVCDHLVYKAQDFAQYEGGADSSVTGGLQWEKDQWHYGQLDYIGNIWQIDEKEAAFDAILCSEVLEHIPYPRETIEEFARLLKKDGTLILTAPYACLPHMNPYFFYSGFSKEFYINVADECGLEILEIQTHGNVFSYLFQEMKRSVGFVRNPLLKAWYLACFVVSAPLLKILMKKFKGNPQAELLPWGYFVLARKK